MKKLTQLEIFLVNNAKELPMHVLATQINRSEKACWQAHRRGIAKQEYNAQVQRTLDAAAREVAS